MVNSFEVASVFRVIDAASPALSKILKQVRELAVAIDKAKAGLATLGNVAGLSGAVGETQALANAWREVAKASASATRNMGAAGVAGRRGAGSGGGAGGFRGSGGAGGAAGAPRGGAFRGASTAATGVAGLLGYGMYEEMLLEDGVAQIQYHAAQSGPESAKRFRDIIQNASASTGFGIKEIVEAVKDDIRMMKGTVGGGLEALPEMLQAAATEARLKGTSLHESMTAIIGLSHMTKEYGTEGIKKLAPVFAFLSAANPASLAGIERAASYAVPILQSNLEVDPVNTLLLGTVLTRAGATNTKSGTWLREAAMRAMPGTSLMSKMAYKKHEAALKEAGLVDEKGAPTWFTDGKPDLVKMLDVAGTNMANIPVERRAAVGKAIFGTQGANAVAMLGDSNVRSQIHNLREELMSPEFRARYSNFQENYKNESPLQQFRIGMADFRNVLMDIGTGALPSATAALREFDEVIKKIRAALPGGDKKGGGEVGKTALEGAVIGAGVGTFFPGVGTVGGAAIGGIVGGVYGLAQDYMKSAESAKAAAPEVDRYGRAVVITGNSAEQAASGMSGLAAAIRGLLGSVGGAGGSVYPGGTQKMNNVIRGGGGSAPVVIHTAFNIDGRKIATAVTRHQVTMMNGPVQGSVYPDSTSAVERNDTRTIFS